MDCWDAQKGGAPVLKIEPTGSGFEEPRRGTVGAPRSHIGAGGHTVLGAILTPPPTWAYALVR